MSLWPETTFQLATSTVTVNIFRHEYRRIPPSKPLSFSIIRILWTNIVYMKDKVLANLWGKNILKTQYNRFIVWGFVKENSCIFPFPLAQYMDHWCLCNRKTQYSLKSVAGWWISNWHCLSFNAWREFYVSFWADLSDGFHFFTIH
jgi:hypothetical protein